MKRTFSWVRRHLEPIGLDMGTRFVRMVQLACHRGLPALIACAQQELPIGNHSPAELHQLQAEAIKELLARGRFQGRHVVTALGWDDLQMRNLRVPNMPEEEIEQAIRFEAADRFGFNPDQAEVRFLIAGDVRQGTEVRQEVIALGSSRAAIDQRLKLLESLHLESVSIDAAPCAVFRGFERFLRRIEDAEQVNAFLDIGYSSSRVIMSRGANINFIKSISIGGRRFDELAAEAMDLSIDDAARMRVRLHRQHIAALTGQLDKLSDEERVGENMQRATLDAIRPALEQLSKEVALCLRYCSVTFRGPRSGSVTVVGGEACNKDMLQLLTDQTSIPFVVGRPVRNISLEDGEGGAERRTGQPEWATALGLALKSMNQLAAVAS